MKRRDGMRKKTALIILSILMATLLLGCSKNIKISTGFAKDEIFKIGGETEKLSSMLVLLINEKNKYEKSMGADIWERSFDGIRLEDEIKNKVKTQLVELNVIYAMAKQDETELTSEEQDSIQAAAQEYFESLSDKEKELTGITQKQIEKLYEKMFLSDKYYEKKVQENEKEISDESAKVIEVMYIYFKTADSDVYGKIIPFEESVIEEKRVQAQNVLESIRQGSDFQALALTYSDDTNYRSTFGRGEMQEEFEAAAFALEDGQCSEIVERPDGFYLIKCVEDYLAKETEDNKDKMKERYEADSFRKLYEPYMKKQTLEFHTRLWDKILVKDYEDCTNDQFFVIYQTYFGE